MSTYLQGWLDAERSRRDAIVIRRIYLQLCNNNFHDAAILNQIMYWHENDANGNRRLTIYKDGYWWLAKKYQDWENECSVDAATARDCIDRLKERGLVITKVYHFLGVPTTHIRVNPEGFEQAMRTLSEETPQIEEVLSEEIPQMDVRETHTSYISESTPPTTPDSSVLLDRYKKSSDTAGATNKMEEKPGRADASALENFILESVRGKIDVKGKRLPTKLVTVLSNPVNIYGKSYQSPNELFDKDPQFKNFVMSRIEYAHYKGKSIEQLCYIIAEYGWAEWGWLDWKKGHSETAQVAPNSKLSWWDMPTLPDGYEIKKVVSESPFGGWFVLEELYKDGVWLEEKHWDTEPTKEEAIVAYRKAKSL